MLRVGHIDFSNCYPVHALLLEGPPPGISVVTGEPTALNAALAAGRVDVAPCSSIEYARHADRYRILPGLAIGSDGPVGSILLESRVPPDALDGELVAVPTASATSVTLLRLLLEVQIGVRPSYRWFDQSGGPDPLATGAAAALWIGDVALRRPAAAERQVLDLGAAWRRWTGLPFAFAVWQTAVGSERNGELRWLHGLLLESLAYFRARSGELAARQAVRYGLEPAFLQRYWSSLRYELDDAMEEGLRLFHRLAACIAEAPASPPLRWVPLAEPAARDARRASGSDAQSESGGRGARSAASGPGSAASSRGAAR